jgi:hypothetical protein
VTIDNIHLLFVQNFYIILADDLKEESLQHFAITDWSAAVPTIIINPKIW